jgi:hypothetical protein
MLEWCFSLEDDPEYLEKANKYTELLLESHKEMVQKLEADVLLKVLNKEAEKNGEGL